jgi:hypothetical protein
LEITPRVLTNTFGELIDTFGVLTVTFGVFERSDGVTIKERSPEIWATSLNIMGS